jgi:hypothetical protein
LKRAKVEAKRAARAAAKGFDGAAIAAQLDDFVRAAGDLKVRRRGALWGDFGREKRLIRDHMGTA